MACVISSSRFCGLGISFCSVESKDAAGSSDANTTAVASAEPGNASFHPFDNRQDPAKPLAIVEQCSATDSRYPFPYTQLGPSCYNTRRTAGSGLHTGALISS
ncbi:3526_t:CDS:2 [Paraglomus brasilianum]|uniref:3526_t:CDS:1 n=1 Tax=Paraglomus brasilianum TaxID=144538 RepID=A0A9N9GKU9_9GLOM|nr:3526_t:CDS:2 [Paraglomus brasilianum]